MNKKTAAAIKKAENSAWDRVLKIRAAREAILAHFKQTGGIQRESTIAAAAGLDFKITCIAARQLADEGLIFPVDHEYDEVKDQIDFAYALTSRGNKAVAELA